MSITVPLRDAQPGDRLVSGNIELVIRRIEEGRFYYGHPALSGAESQASLDELDGVTVLRPKPKFNPIEGLPTSIDEAGNVVTYQVVNVNELGLAPVADKRNCFADRNEAQQIADQLDSSVVLKISVV